MPTGQATSKQVIDAARTLYLDGCGPTVISKRLGVNPRSVMNWASRQGWRNQLHSALAETAVTVAMSRTGPTGSTVSDRVRSNLAVAIERQAFALSRETVKTTSQLANKGGVQGWAAVAKTVAETAAVVFGWKSESLTGVLIVSGSQPPPPPMRQANATSTDAAERVIPEPTPDTAASDPKDPSMLSGPDPKG